MSWSFSILDTKIADKTMSSPIIGDLVDSEFPVTSPVIEKPELALVSMNALQIQGSESFGTKPAMPGNDTAATEETWHATLGLPVLTNSEGPDGDKTTNPGVDHFPAEIREQIWKWAMTADKGKFTFTDVSSEFKPNIATGLLRVNHEIYHGARKFLYTENNFVFQDLGSDLRILAQPRGLWSCKTVGCNGSTAVPTFTEVTLGLGDDSNAANGELKLQCIAAALERLRSEVNIKNLTIYFRDYCWGYCHGPKTLSAGLSKLNVTGELIMFGADFHWEQKMRDIPRALRMNIVPQKWTFIPGRRPLFFKGFFRCEYIPATTSEETEEKVGEVVDDAGHAYEEYKAKLEIF